jgi:hypothetical protein
VVAVLLRGYNYLYKVSIYQIKFDWSQASCPKGTTVVVVTIATAVVALYNVKRRSDKQQSAYFYVPNV